MKRRITLLIALVLSIAFVSLMSLDSTAKAARPQRYVANTGMIPLGPNQLLRVTLVRGAGGAVLGEPVTFTATISVDSYSRGTCNDGVCRYSISSQTTSDPITLAPGEAASADSLPGDYALWRANFGSSPSPPNVEVNAFIIDATTGAVVGYTGGVRVAVADVTG